MSEFYHKIMIIFLLLSTEMFFSDSLEETYTETYEYLKNAVEGESVELPFCEYGSYVDLPQHLNGSERVTEKYFGWKLKSIVIKNLQKNDTGRFYCKHRTGTTIYILQVHQTEDLIQLSCTGEKYLYIQSECYHINCTYESIHRLTQISVYDPKSRKNLDSKYLINETSSSVYIATKPHKIRRTNIFQVKASSLPSIVQKSNVSAQGNNGTEQDTTWPLTCEGIQNASENTTENTPMKKSTGILIGSNLAIIVMLVIPAAGYIIYLRARSQQSKNRRIRITNELRRDQTECLNPELSIKEQAHLLPLDRKWEFPRRQLKLGKQLGSGVFGAVFQGEIMAPGGAKTTVAVKMAHKHLGWGVLSALIAELKIMSHMGRHPHIVQLLGAVTDGLGDNELLVIVEYCSFGNLSSYLVKNRRRFLDNWMDKHLAYVNVLEASESFDEDTVLNTVDTEGAGNSGYEVPSVKKATEGVRFLQNNSENQEMAFNTKILVSWSYQIASGMEWLATKRLIHGDLAARNILLTTNNLVKICDFGLAKNVYTKSYYKYKTNALLPVRWLAIESLTDQVFTLKSDVWSYGVLLWEIFSLGMAPYPEFSSLAEHLSNLQRGYRLGRPQHIPEYLFQLMIQCWKQDPEERPFFSDLSSGLFYILDATQRRILEEVKDACLHEGDLLLSPTADQ